jgi:hypothetical protein
MPRARAAHRLRDERGAAALDVREGDDGQAEVPGEIAHGDVEVLAVVAHVLPERHRRERRETFDHGATHDELVLGSRSICTLTRTVVRSDM